VQLLLGHPAPYTTAQSWVVLEQDSSKLLFGRCEKERWEIASLTKMMTAYTTLKLITQLKIDYETELITIPEESQVEGTSADLVPGDQITLNQLLYGMMLPSGNDAAMTLAFHFGSILLPRKK
jgi:serine-type D-Ala-D-Ala carboxypeptidase (penicillin-binding protein 5/6)